MENLKDSAIPEEDASPYREIEQRVREMKRAPRKPWMKVGSSFLGATLAISFLSLGLHGIIQQIAASGQAQEESVTVRVKSSVGYRAESYAELAESERDSIDFADSLPIEELSLEGTTVTVQSDYANSVDTFVLYQPGGNVFFSNSLPSFRAGEAVDISNGLTSGADYLLCYGNPRSERLRPVVFPGGATLDGTGISLIVDPALLMTVLVRVA